MRQLVAKAQIYYQQHSTRVDAGFFLGGFLFDVVTLSQIDDLFSILQQLLYLAVVGGVLSLELLWQEREPALGPRSKRVWDNRSFLVHFLLGSLLSVYSLFFLKSASVVSSLTFVGLLMLIMVANELEGVQRRGVDTKVGLFVICLFSFFSMLVPVALGFVGVVPFLLALLLTGAVLYGWFRWLQRRLLPREVLVRRLLAPGASVAGLFFLFYLIGWIPPVPLAVEEMGIYHRIEKTSAGLELYHENPWWKFWNHGDQDFRARPGDTIYFFARIFSPARFDDSVILHWQKFDLAQGWVTTDKIPMRVTGGRSGGYRGHATKANYAPGDWRVAVETTDGREIGRLAFHVTRVEGTAVPEFQKELR